MRIAFLLQGFPSTTETFILSQITGLRDRGHNVDIIADEVGEATAIHAEIEHYQLLKHTTYIGIPHGRMRRFFKGTALVLAHLWRRPKAFLQSLDQSRYGRWARSTLLHAVAYLSQKPGNYDIVHCHFGPYGLKGAFLRDLGVLRGKLITSFHGYDVSLLPKRYGKQVYQPLFEQGDAFLVISDRMKQQLVDLGCDPQKVIVHRVGIDTNRFQFSPRQPPSDRPVRLITIARLVEKKGIEYGIRAVAQLSQTHPNIEYFIVGDGPLWSSLQQLVDELKVASAVKMVGAKSQEDVIHLLDQSDILLAPSVTSQIGDQEGIPVVLMEAMARGLPVISTLHSGIPELVEHDVSGLLVPERDVEALVEQLQYLIDHPERWPIMGQAGRTRVETNHNLSKLNDQLVALYQQLIDGASSSASILEPSRVELSQVGGLSGPTS